ncbi:hypothetical protein MKW94_022480 [Papaver nudicaule]|uniref:F-box/LRR-repeat protein 15-like leucin rich repeat domain-containing protein n=1 Tax=Papaver nudicaule TaxID=74823 RepID=A0AA41V3X5_PAPNU|nr:hypothetical protein [Papaver nudicaule]
MISLSPNNKYNQGSGKTYTSKAVQQEEAKINCAYRPCKIRRTTSSITNLPGDCINLIFKCLTTVDDRNSFGLTCRDWLHVQNNSHISLWYRNHYHPYNKHDEPDKYPKISPESLAKITCRLLIRFQQLKHLSLGRLPNITNVVTLNSQPFGSNVQTLYLENCYDHCYSYSDMQLSLIFSWFPRLTYINLHSSDISDKGLEALAKCCSSLEKVCLPWCCSITDSGISHVLRNCREICSLDIECCSRIIGICFIGCGQTLTHLKAGGCNFKPEGIRAIVSGGGLKYLNLKTPDELTEFKEGCIINTEAVMTISKGCPLLEKLFLSDCEEVELEGWKAIGLNCKELDFLDLIGCKKLCDMGLQAICDGCSKLSGLRIDREKNRCSSYALEIFKRKKPGVMRVYA